MGVRSVSGDHQCLVTAQATAALDTRKDCERCGRAHRHKDTRTIVLRTPEPPPSAQVCR
jgi:hypothetical protein